MLAERKISADFGRNADRGPRPAAYAFCFAIIAAFVFFTHAPLLKLPFYWDELGQFVPASLDLFQLGDWVPVTTVPNIHPPGLMVYLSAVWHVTGYSIAASRAAMLLLATFGACWTFRLGIELGRGAGCGPACVGATFLCISPLFAAQSMMVQLDMPAMVFTTLAVLLFLQEQLVRAALACVVLVAMKETGIVAPAVFGLLLLKDRRWKAALLFTAPLAPLGIWLISLHGATGHWAGNASFAVYNAVYSLHPVRFALALLRRLYYLFLGTGHWVGTAAILYAWRHSRIFRSRGWLVVALYTTAHVLLVSLFGGAVLERYLLPVLPLLYISFALALWTLPSPWKLAGSLGLLAMLAAGNFVNPLYPFPFENNFAYVSFCHLHRNAARFLEERYPNATVATTFPLAGGLRRPAFGYVSRPMKVREIDNFETPAIAALAKSPPEVLVLYSVAWDPLKLLTNRTLVQLLHRYYGYEPQASGGEVARLLHMHATARWTEGGQWIEVFHANE